MEDYVIRDEAILTDRLDGAVEIKAALSPSDPVLSEFFAGYDRSFVLPSEKEELRGFRDCLLLNLSPQRERIEATYGAFREYVLVAKPCGDDPGAQIGGANFICYPLQMNGNKPVLAVNLNYLYVLPEHRGKGWLRRLYAACQNLARQSFRPCNGGPPTETLPVMTFIEQNDPLKMSAADYARDTEYTGMDQMQRIGLWARMGARILDFDYVQPALSPEQHPDRNLVLAVLGADGAMLEPQLLHEHLKRFFAISVLKGGDPATNADARDQLNLLLGMSGNRQTIRLLDPRSWIDGRANHVQDLPGDGTADLRTALRNHEAWLQPGKLYWTLSILVEKERLDHATKVERRPPEYAAWLERLRDNANRTHYTGAISRAVDPMFHDIADRSRQIFFDEALLDPQDFDKTPQRISLVFPAAFEWGTEGTTSQARFATDLVWSDVDYRYYWFLHSNGALTYHFSLEIPYEHRLQHYYAMSVLQKRFFPSEMSTNDPELANDSFPIRVRHDGTETELHAFVRSAFTKHIHRLISRPDPTSNKAGAWKSLLGSTSDKRDAWDQLVTGHGDDDHDRSGDPMRPVPGVAPRPAFCRAAYLLEDPFFEQLLRTRERSLAAVPSVMGRFKLAFLDASADSVARYDYTKQADLQDLESRHPGPLALIFLSGFLHNIIDFFEQDESELADATTPLHQDSHFLLYATQESVFEIVDKSGSLERAREYIGTCPYLFLVHVMALQDEALVCLFERHVRTLSAMIEKKEELEGNEETRELLDKFHKRRKDIFLGVERYTHLNVFRYETEQNFYEQVERIRGIANRRAHWEERLTRLSEAMSGMHELAQQKADTWLNKLALAIAVFGVFQVLFALTGNWRQFQPFDEDERILTHPDVGDALSASVFLLATIVGILLTRRELKKMTAPMKQLLILGEAILVILLIGVVVGIWRTWRLG